MSKVNTGQASSTLIPKYIGSDFDKVVAVADNIEQVVAVSNNTEDVGTVADNINYVKEVAEDLHGMPVTMYTGENPPVLNPMPEGVMWYCTTDGRTYVWYTDADSGQWVESAPQSAMKDEATNIFFHSIPSNVNSAYRNATLFSTPAPEAEISVAHNALNTPVVQAQFIREEALWVDVSVTGAQGIVTLMGYSSGNSQLKAEIITWKNGAEGTSLGTSQWVTLPNQPSVVSLPVTLANIDVLDAGDSYVVKLSSQMNAGGSAVSTILVDGNTSSRFGIIFNTNLIGLFDGIRDGVITSAPTENAVYDALQLKAVKTEVSDALQLKVGKSQLVQSGNLTSTANWANVPAYSDSELGGLAGPLNAQAKALTARSELLLSDVREALRRSYAEAGYNVVGTFGGGFTIVNANDVGVDLATGKGYTGPAGPVAAGTNPASGGFVDRSGYLTTFVAEMVGISTTNTPQQNTAAMDAFRAANPGASLAFFSGVYPFDVYRDSGLKKVRGRGKELTKITLLGAATPVSGQFGGAEVSDIHFESVAGSLANQRCEFKNGARLMDGKISGFIHSVPAPNAWGVFLSNSKGCKLIRVEFDNNSQSIAVVEGTEGLEIDGCFSSTGNLVINYEPNVNTPSTSKTTLRNMDIAKLYLQSNDQSAESDYAVVVENCKVQKLVYDGLGVDFINTEIVSYEQPYGSQVYAGKLAGVSVYQELILDPTLTVVCDSSNSASFWRCIYSTTPPVDRYGRAPDYALRIGVNGVAASTMIVSKKFLVPTTPLLVSFIRSVTVNGGRPEVTQIEFFNSADASLSVVNLVRGFNSDYELVSAIVVPPAGAVTARINLFGGDVTSNYQQVNYKHVSVRPISIVNTQGAPLNIDFSGVASRAKVGITKALFDVSQHYWAPLPVGTEIEFEYAAAGVRLAKITTAATDATGKLGTLQIIANYP